MPQDVPSTSDCRLIELKNQVQRLMEAHLAPMQPTQVNKINSSCEICSGLHDNQYYMENPEQAFIEYTSSHIVEARGAQTPYYAMKDFLDCHLPGEWEIVKDAEINPFKDVLVFSRMIKNGDQPLPRVTQVSIAGTTSTEQHPLKDKSMCNKIVKDLWDALARHMIGLDYGEQDRKAAVLYEYETFKATEGELL
nr:hypothetical protein [Tanacetum cinerariifolium]